MNFRATNNLISNPYLLFHWVELLDSFLIIIFTLFDGIVLGRSGKGGREFVHERGGYVRQDGDVVLKSRR